MGILDKVKSSLKTSSGVAAPEMNLPPAPAAPALDQSIPRYRRQRGVNLGSWFVTEDWLCGGLYARAADPKKSDFDLARAPGAKEIMEAHWDSWICKADWEWIRGRGFNSVRLPIGYYHLAKPLPEVLKGTDYEPYAGVYEGAWDRILAAVDTAAQHGLGVLVDFHAAPGAQNEDAHSGTSGGKVNFWHKRNLANTSVALRFLASTFASNPNVVGLELLNEPKNDNRLQGWYESTLNEVRAVAGPHFPIYVSDGWDTAWYSKWDGGRDDFVVVDHHLYRCFAPEDRKRSGRDHADTICHQFAHQYGDWCRQAHGRVVVGEWSAGLDESCLPGNTPAGERDAQKRAFVAAQLDVFEQGGGYWFWTLKTDADWNAGWSAYNAAQAEILPQSMVRKRLNQPPGGAQENAAQQACDQHCNYSSQHGGHPNPQAFMAGFNQGWDDALMFLQHDQSELAFARDWARRRMEGMNLGGDAWQYEQALAQGVGACHAHALQ